LLDSGNVDAADGALDALFKACMPYIHACSCFQTDILTARQSQICEEDASNLDYDIPGLATRPSAALMPRLLNFFSRCLFAWL
jgi:hypothetical protein